jgi:PLP dependent protein
MSIAENLKGVRTAIAAAAVKCGRDPESVTLVAVTKTWPASVIREVTDAGQKILGENKVQELLEKVGELPGDIEWHLIGHLQQNKTRKVLPHCALIHSVDSFDLASQISRIAGELGITAEVLLQVNVASDDAKFGFPVDEVTRVFGALSEFPNLKIRGLMTVPPFDEDTEQVRPHFARLRTLRDELAGRHSCDLPELSMGMSHDFGIAIEEGATLVRVGSSIFGGR